jgi:hypothetical protein
MSRHLLTGRFQRFDTAHNLRGHPTATVVKGKTFHNPGALDLQPRQGSKKAAVGTHAPIHPGMTAQQRAVAGTGGLGHPTSRNIVGGSAVPSKAAAPMRDAYGSIPKAHIGEVAPPSWSHPVKAGKIGDPGLHPAMRRLGLNYDDLRSLGSKLPGGGK